jgi:hypothetical protein
MSGATSKESFSESRVDTRDLDREREERGTPGTCAAAGSPRTQEEDDTPAVGPSALPGNNELEVSSNRQAVGSRRCRST